MLGVKRDALISNGGVAGSGSRGDVFDISWDGMWEVEGKVYEGYYLIELKFHFQLFIIPRTLILGDSILIELIHKD